MLDVKMKHSLFKLKNGLPVIVIDTQTFPSATVLLLIGAGSRYENKENNGIAHFLEHMAFKGSKKYPSSFSISSVIDRIGARNNAFTAKDYTGFFIKGSVDVLPTIFDILSDMIQYPLLDAKEIEKEKGVVKEEIALYEDMPHRRVRELYEAMLYEGSSLGFNIAGTKETVSSFTREMVIAYLSKWYYPNNAVLVIAGGVGKIKNLKKLINNYYGSWNPGIIGKRYEKIKETVFEPRTEVYKKKTEQTHICIGYRTFGRHDKKKYALFLLSAILGSGMSSRLFIELREKRGLCYYVSTQVDLHEETGHLTTQAGVRSNASVYRGAIALIKYEHEKIAEKGVDEEELKRVKAMIKGNTILSLENSAYIAGEFGMSYLHFGKIITPFEHLKKIESVKREEIQDVAKLIVKDERLNICAIK